MIGAGIQLGKQSRRRGGGGGGGGGGANTFFLTPANTVFAEAFTQRAGTSTVNIVDDPASPGARNCWQIDGSSSWDLFTFDAAGESDTVEMTALLYQVGSGGSEMTGVALGAINETAPGFEGWYNYFAGFDNYGPRMGVTRVAPGAFSSRDMSNSGIVFDDMWSWFRVRMEPTGIENEVRLRMRGWVDGNAEPDVWHVDVSEVWVATPAGYTKTKLSGLVGLSQRYDENTAIAAIGIGMNGAVAPTS